MSNDTRNYYEIQLAKIDFTRTHSAQVIFGSEGVSTKAMAVNAESAAAIIAKLVEVFMFPAVRPEAEAAPVERAHHVSYKTGRDKNGNKIVHCSSREGGFTIQTNGNLPQTHRDGVTAGTDAEVCAYVAKHGNARRKRILGI